MKREPTPSHLRSGTNTVFGRGAKVEFIDTQERIVEVPVVQIEILFGTDKSRVPTSPPF
jgi:hypothetical protein